MNLRVSTAGDERGDTGLNTLFAAAPPVVPGGRNGFDPRQASRKIPVFKIAEGGRLANAALGRQAPRRDRAVAWK